MFIKFDVVKTFQAPPERRDLIETDPVALIHRAIENAKPLMNLVIISN